MSTEQQGPPQMEGLRASKQEEEGEGEEEREGEGEGDAKVKLIRAKEVMDEKEECRTPTWPGNQIPAIEKCPPAPRKKRRAVPPFSSHMRRSSASELSFGEIRPEEVESFFQSLYCYQLTRLNKRCRSV